MDIYFILPTISTSFIVLSAIFMAIGIYHVKKGNVQTHEKFMTFAAISALAFFIVYISKTVFLGNTQFGGPDWLEIYYVIFLISHIILSTTGGIFGGIQVFTGKKNKLRQHRKFGMTAAAIWSLTAITGVMVYIILYVLYPGGETTGLWDAIFH
ncbi:hypothetical protein BN1048_00437 [Jeotgalicoccus saudimassiliensis]|uniref:DUF420 domain-containing protein n=1 Tax=Jeotgalicoccus saudimassiliensis TaxID=1461582 RepID=A0A078LZC0_9STAP|nr:DUF420 domain-containing protein [Jeotgalicoccus saudimassiliensis]CDZ99379.1 hypothetical protein BN1048_00437 [Jeotgalicoccus saudimassiliensis]